MIHFLRLLTIVFTLPLISTAQEPIADRQSVPVEETEDGFVPLFDGKLLLGWEGKAYWFRVEDKAIVAGRLDERIPHNYFLCTTRTYDDFELRLEVKTVGTGVNAGVQFRTKRIPGSDEVSGYQADVGGVAARSVWGALYDESRRKKFLVEPNAELIQRVVRPDDWNDLVIRCEGPSIKIFLNGEQTVDYREADETVDTRGVISLQIHSGPPSETWYRNLRIKPL